MINESSEGDVAIIQLDDGKANALSHDMMNNLDAALERALESKAVVIAGRPGRFCAGFDLKEMMASPERASALVVRGCKFMADLALFPRPVVMACTGHARAGGAMLLTAGDYRVGVEGPFGLGLNEMELGLPIPRFGLALLKERCSRRRYVEATMGAKIYDPATAIEAGYLDEVVAPDALMSTAIAEASRRGAFANVAYAVTKKFIRGPMIESVRGTAAEDMKHFKPGG